jgi:HK97 family phage major capsid protein
MNTHDRELIESLHRPPKPIFGSRQERNHYQISRAINALAMRQPQTASFEQEIQQELIRRGAEKRLSNSILLPVDVLQRDLNVASAAQGGYLVDTSSELLGFVDLARPRSVLLTLGATVVGGLRENVSVPRITTGTTVHWLESETSAPTEGQPSLGQIALTPKSVGTYTEVSRKLATQMSAGAELLLRNELVGAIGQAIDVAGLGGTGTSGQPIGVSLTPGIGSVSGTTLAYAQVLAMQTNAAASLSQFGGYAAPAAVGEIMAQRVRFAGTASPLWEGSLYRGTVIGYPAMASGNVPTGQLLFGGDWSTVLVASWGDAIEVAVNPYANFSAGIVGLRVIHSIDIAVRQPSTFTATTTVN